MDNVSRLTLSVEEAAKVVGISRDKMYQLVRVDGFPTIRIGSKLLVSAKGLEQWLDNQAAKGWSA